MPRRSFAELEVEDAKVAVIRSELDPEVVVKEYRNGALRPTGLGPELDEQALRESVIVGQMGIHPLMTALESGAQYILAGRSCDIALFASDMIRRGIDAGLAYHVGHVLECGALACDPGSPSDCLVAEIYDDGTALFTAPNLARRCTAYSIAAHSLYEESHPQLQFYPEGILVMEKTQFFSRDSRTAGIRGSQFVRSRKPWPWSIKLEGIAPARCAQGFVDLYRSRGPSEYSRPTCWSMAATACRRRRSTASQRELGIIIETAAPTQEAADSAREPADALSHSLRLSRPQGDRGKHRLSAVAEPRQLQARGRPVRRDRAERDARSRVLRELCRASRPR